MVLLRHQVTVRGKRLLLKAVNEDLKDSIPLELTYKKEEHCKNIDELVLHGHNAFFCAGHNTAFTVFQNIHFIGSFDASTIANTWNFESYVDYTFGSEWSKSLQQDHDQLRKS